MPKASPKNKINTGRFKKGCVGIRKGVPVSEETREKMRQAKIGKKVTFSDSHKRNLSIALKGKERPHLQGKKRIFTEDWKENIRLSKVGQPSKSKGKSWKINPIHIPAMKERMLGSKNPSYIFDRSKLAKKQIRNDGAYFEWRNLVKARDCGKCRIDNKNCGGRIEVHHILKWSDYPNLRYEVNNGITLCKLHHPRKKVEEIRMISTFRELIF